jgi:hypothetical protein
MFRQSCKTHLGIVEYTYMSCYRCGRYCFSSLSSLFFRNTCSPSRKSYFQFIFPLSLPSKVLVFLEVIYNVSTMNICLGVLPVPSPCRHVQIRHVKALLLAFTPIACSVSGPFALFCSAWSLRQYVRSFY